MEHIALPYKTRERLGGSGRGAGPAMDSPNICHPCAEELYGILHRYKSSVVFTCRDVELQNYSFYLCYYMQETRMRTTKSAMSHTIVQLTL